MLKNTDIFYLMSLIAVVSAQGLPEGLYCGVDNCYDVLGVARESTKNEIVKTYRKLARKWHPDMHPKETKEEAQGMFQTIANAYEILKDEDSRRDYDYMLDNPEEYYYNYYAYYRRRMAPKVDVRIVVAVTISIISVIQYWSAYNNYNMAIAYFVTVPKYRMQAQDIARKEGLLDPSGRRRKDRTKTKDEIKEEEEGILRKVIGERMDIRGGYGKPSILNILWLQMVLLPYYIVKYIAWFGRWIWKFTIMKEEYGDEEKEHVMRKSMGLSQGQWDTLEDHEHEEYYNKELWIKEKFVVWKEKKEEEMKIKLAENARYKSYRRYMKKGGPGQMTFGPE